MITDNDQIKKKIYTVSELTSSIKDLLEDNFPIVWICGEISNFSAPLSGHYYFTLKDDDAQISAVMFKGQNRRLTFSPEQGMGITGLGRISVYEPRGRYQFIIEYMEPQGLGSLQAAFEQLKAKLSIEGLFDDAHKAEIPFLPNNISVITSPTGAVIHDILNILNRRYPNLHINIFPVKVQGKSSETEIVDALNLANEQGDSDLIILARGGGSLEDLSPFNSELVARAIFASKIPVISAIGHETDYTIADFTADLRAPTPSAAAELAVPNKNDLYLRISELRLYLKNSFNTYLNHRILQLQSLTKQLIDPKRKVDDLRLKTDDYTIRLQRSLTNTLKYNQERLEWLSKRLVAGNPLFLIKTTTKRIDHAYERMLMSIDRSINYKRNYISELSGKMEALSPLSILERGYSITRTIPDNLVVKDPEDVTIGSHLDVMVAKGSFKCRVEGKEPHGKEKEDI